MQGKNQPWRFLLPDLWWRTLVCVCWDTVILGLVKETGLREEQHLIKGISFD